MWFNVQPIRFIGRAVNISPMYRDLLWVHKGTLLGKNEIARIRNKEWLNLLRRKKLYLLLDLDHTLLNLTQLQDVTPDEANSLRVDMLNNKDISNGKVETFRLDSMNMLTKLRPFVRTFLKEASKLFEMGIYTMGKRSYALQMGKLLDSGNVYFRFVIAQEDCTQRYQKGLDVVLVKESAVLILDDTEEKFCARMRLSTSDRFCYLFVGTLKYINLVILGMGKAQEEPDKDEKKQSLCFKLSSGQIASL
ncbi:hypothetical protein RHSIM_Rhsim01G0067000 [Rhododendron simsii]|uniref:protein-serine/threonine phosphatase n=1 Tax=Rhododendron simsii TaxID=118357 RepID=A0A834HFN8_RHOSS|nr:hypothetical protein RHSIM_Rhsim01G0067000 [Rhododendron simsii]